MAGVLESCRRGGVGSNGSSGSTRVSPLLELIARKRSLEFSDREAASRRCVLPTHKRQWPLSDGPLSAVKLPFVHDQERAAARGMLPGTNHSKLPRLGATPGTPVQLGLQPCPVANLAIEAVRVDAQ